MDTGDRRSVREANVEAFLDPAERLLVREGAAGISTRQLAREAGQNHGLVHYYFGSGEETIFLLPTWLIHSRPQEIGRQVDYRDVEVDGAANAARRIAALL